MAESAKSLTSLVLLVIATGLFAAGWNGDAHAQRRLADERSRRLAPPVAEPRPAVPSHSVNRDSELTRMVDPSPLARFAPGRYRMTDAAGRVAWVVIEPSFSSGLPPRNRVSLLNIDGSSMVLIRQEDRLAGAARTTAVR